MRKLLRLYKAERDDIADLVTYRVLPTTTGDTGQFEPFLFLNHHGPQIYPPGNRGLPFAPHPHRGFETLTFIRKGELMHRDSSGCASVIKAGGVQWMTAGSGIIHEEISSDVFKKVGGEVEILQLWINLPAALKFTKPNYVGMQRADIKMQDLPDGQGNVQIISGQWLSEKANYQSLTGVDAAALELKAHADLKIPVNADRRIFVYVVQGQVAVNSHDLQDHNLGEFEVGEGGLEIHAQSNACIFLATAKPLGEPIVSHGPFVMNTKAEIHEAIFDYQAGKFGSWNH
ncbi:MAG: pirin family protein [Chitinophagaceae bacterium]|nr:pirin family protein [Oligoflexus sp.]